MALKRWVSATSLAILAAGCDAPASRDECADALEVVRACAPELPVEQLVCDEAVLEVGAQYETTGECPDPDAVSDMKSDLAINGCDAGRYRCGGIFCCEPEPIPPTDPHPSGTTWEQRAPIPWGAREEHAVVGLEGQVYVLGGMSAFALELTERVFAYSPQSDTWTEKAPLPDALHHLNAVAAGGRIYVVGALRGFYLDPLYEPHDAVYAFDPDASELGEWTLEARFPDGTERGASAVAALGDQILVAGGEQADHHALAAFWAYDAAERSWQQLPDLPLARHHLVGAVVGEEFFAIGGQEDDLDTRTGRMDVFDLRTQTWREGPPMPTARGGAAVAVVDGTIVVAGGQGDGVFEQVERYDPRTQTWTELAPMPAPRHGMGAAVIDGDIHYPGGSMRQVIPTNLTALHHVLRFE